MNVEIQRGLVELRFAKLAWEGAHMRMQSFDGVTVSGHVLDSAGHPVADCPVGIEALTPNIGLWELDASSNSDGYWSRPVPSNASYEFQASYRGSNDKHQASTRVDVGATDVDGVDIILPGVDQAWALLHELVKQGLQEANILHHPPQTSEQLQALAGTVTTSLMVGGASPQGLYESPFESPWVDEPEVLRD